MLRFNARATKFTSASCSLPTVGLDIAASTNKRSKFVIQENQKLFCQKMSLSDSRALRNFRFLIYYALAPDQRSPRNRDHKVCSCGKRLDACHEVCLLQSVHTSETSHSHCR